MKHILTLIRPPVKLGEAGCSECKTSCQSACKTSCTVSNQVCQR